MATSKTTEKFTPAFKRRAVKMVRSEKKVKMIACELSIAEDQLRVWKLQSLNARMRRQIKALDCFIDRENRDKLERLLLLQESWDLWEEAGRFRSSPACVRLLKKVVACADSLRRTASVLAVYYRD